MKVAGEGGGQGQVGQGQGRAALPGQVLRSLCCQTGTACGSHLSEALSALLLAPLRKAVQVRKPHAHAALACACNCEAAATVV